MYSAPFYLDDLKNAWGTIYENQDLDTDLPGVLGAEAAMWGEHVDETNAVARVWPRAVWPRPVPSRTTPLHSGHNRHGQGALCRRQSPMARSDPATPEPNVHNQQRCCHKRLNRMRVVRGLVHGGVGYALRHSA